MNNKKWIWQHDDYPHFMYDASQIEPLIYTLIEKSGELKGRMASLSNNEELSFSIETALEEILTTSQIEGVVLQRDSVRSSLRKKLDKAFNREEHSEEDTSTKNTDSLTELYVDSRFNKENLTTKRLHTWHTSIFKNYKDIFKPVEKGIFRKHDDMYIISGAGLKEKVHYHAMPARQISDSICQLTEYCNVSTKNFIIKSAVAHLWFESIHPYDDGNGRVGRALVNYILSKDGGLDNRYYSISSAIKQDRKGYYSTLEKTQNLFYNRAFDVTQWIIWHTKTIEKSIDISIDAIKIVMDKTLFHAKIKHIKINNKQLKVINKLLDVGAGNFEGGLTNHKYRAMTKTTPVTASRHLKDLLNKGILLEMTNRGGRSTSYVLNS